MASGSSANNIAKWASSTTNIENNLIENNSVIVYPNPSKGQVNIVNSHNIDEIKITNILGQVIYQTKPNTKEVALQIEQAGIYFITLASDKETTTRKTQ